METLCLCERSPWQQLQQHILSQKQCNSSQKGLLLLFYWFFAAFCVFITFLNFYFFTFKHLKLVCEARGASKIQFWKLHWVKVMVPCLVIVFLLDKFRLNMRVCWSRWKFADWHGDTSILTRLPWCDTRKVRGYRMTVWMKWIKLCREAAASQNSISTACQFD